eukprot:CAMPEP_0169386330 /NCGR_PEP_ID=MMETSP1017-20121227/44674_1 /TAXON_ID=342587 /ORGANISM="Karlodinium micrum, Strain CCMP2283" /LENGTH=81 /DNA_ID=CAMNT_0009487489 /DNA_START=148 /DNA_END=393 /DNA_ORIENTATION=+
MGLTTTTTDDNSHATNTFQPFSTHIKQLSNFWAISFSGSFLCDITTNEYHATTTRSICDRIFDIAADIQPDNSTTYPNDIW